MPRGTGFWPPENPESIDFIFVRDKYSFKVLEDLSISQNKFKQTKDAAFLLEPKNLEKPTTKKAAISVREWNYDERNKKHFKNIILAFVKTCINIFFYFPLFELHIIKVKGEK